MSDVSRLPNKLHDVWKLCHSNNNNNENKNKNKNDIWEYISFIFKVVGHFVSSLYLGSRPGILGDF